MLQRNSSTLLGQHKSMPISRADSIDPRISHDQAYTAASLAFNRAQAFGFTDNGKNIQAKAPHQMIREKSCSFDTKAKGLIKRQQSIRFAGPGATRKRQLTGNRARKNQTISKASSSTPTHIAMSSSTALPKMNNAVNKEVSTGNLSSSNAKVSSLRAADSFDDRLTEYRMSNRIWQSTSSSYKRIRKSKPVFNLSEASSLPYTDNIYDRFDTYRGSASNSSNAPPSSQTQTSQIASKPPKSISLLLEKRKKSEENDIAVQLAQNRFLHDTAQQLIRKKSSFLSRSTRSLRRKKTYRESIGTCISNVDQRCNSSTYSQITKESSLKSVAFKASRSLGNKFKKALGRRRDDAIEIPNQQVDANKANDGRFTGDSHLMYEIFSEVPYFDRASVARVVSRIPSICKSASSNNVRSHAGSIKSFQTDTSDEESRATSWGSGEGIKVTVSNPIKSLEPAEQRLSIINENDSRILSSCVQQETLANRTPKYPIIQNRYQGINDKSPVPISVNSARVYSALMKRLDLNNSTQKINVPNKSSPDYLPHPKSTCIADRSKHDRENKDFSTIRHVISEHTTNDSKISSSFGDCDKLKINADPMPLAEEMSIDGTKSYVYRKTEASLVSRIQKKNINLSDDVFYSGDSRIKKEGITAPIKYPQMPKKNQINLIAENPVRSPRHNSLKSVSIQNDLEISRISSLEENFLKYSKDNNTLYTQSMKNSIQRQTEGSNYSPLRVSPAHLYLGHNVSDKSSPCGAIKKLSQQYIPEPAYTESIYSCTSNGQAKELNGSSWSIIPEQNKVARISFPLTPNGGINSNQAIAPFEVSTNIDQINVSPKSNEWNSRISSAAAKFETEKENKRPMFPIPSISPSSKKVQSQKRAQVNDDVSSKSQRQTSTTKIPLGTVQQNDLNIQDLSLHKATFATKNLSSTTPENFNDKQVGILDNKASRSQPKSSIYSLNKSKSIQISPTTSDVMIQTPDSTKDTSNMTRRNRLHYRNRSNTALSDVTPKFKGYEPKSSVKLQRRYIIRPLESPIPSPTKAIFRQRNTSSNSKILRPDSKIESCSIIKDSINSQDELPQNNSSIINTTTKKEQMLQKFLNNRRKRIISTSGDSGYFL